MGNCRDKPDLEFQFEHERYLIDVTFVYDFTTNEARFQKKKEKYENNPGIHSK